MNSAAAVPMVSFLDKEQLPRWVSAASQQTPRLPGRSHGAGVRRALLRALCLPMGHLPPAFPQQEQGSRPRGARQDSRRLLRVQTAWSQSHAGWLLPRLSPPDLDCLSKN